MLYYSTSSLNRPTICLVCWKPIVHDPFTRLHNLTDLCHLISFLSLSLWNPSLVELASILQIIIKEPPTCTSILTDLNHLIFTWCMLRLNWWLNYGINRYTGKVSLVLSYTPVLRTAVWSYFGNSISMVMCSNTQIINVWRIDIFIDFICSII